eukprot:1179529-Prorocentrum_minimum.AAC.6
MAARLTCGEGAVVKEPADGKLYCACCAFDCGFTARTMLCCFGGGGLAPRGGASSGYKSSNMSAVEALGPADVRPRGLG